MKTVANAADLSYREQRIGQIRPLYLNAVTLVERLHRRLLDVIKDEFDRRGRADINSVQASCSTILVSKNYSLPLGEFKSFRVLACSHLGAMLECPPV
jgi:hypothetical protein